VNKEVYEGVRKLTGRFAPRITVVKDERGEILTAEKETRDRWKRYFDGLYNDTNPVNITNLPNMPEYSETESIPGISQAEVESTVSK